MTEKNVDNYVEIGDLSENSLQIPEKKKSYPHFFEIGRFSVKKLNWSIELCQSK